MFAWKLRCIVVTDIHIGDFFNKGVIIFLIDLALKHFLCAVQKLIIMLGNFEDFHLMDFNLQ